MTSIQDAITNTIHDCVADITGYEEETASAVITALRNAGYEIVPIRTKPPAQEPYPPNTECACGDLIHPDMPSVVVEADGVLWHGNSDGGGHRADVDYLPLRDRI